MMLGSAGFHPPAIVILCCRSPWLQHSPEQGVKLFGLLLTWSAGQPLAYRNGLA
jgi:hypothetical protein